MIIIIVLKFILINIQLRTYRRNKFKLLIIDVKKINICLTIKKE